MVLAFRSGAFGAVVAAICKRWQQWNDLPQLPSLELTTDD
jgi:hypothetical protein